MPSIPHTPTAFGGSSSLARAGAMVGLIVTLAAGCSSSAPYIWARNFPPAEGVRRIQAGDTIAVVVKGQADQSGSFVVRENGSFPQPVLGEVAVGGLTESEAAQRLAGLLKGVVVKPRVAVTVTKPRPVRVAVVGEVTRGGSFRFSSTSRSCPSSLGRAGSRPSPIEVGSTWFVSGRRRSGCVFVTMTSRGPTWPRRPSSSTTAT